MSLRLIILGSTGSIGTQALQVVQHAATAAHAQGKPAPLRVVGLAAGRNAALLAAQAASTGAGAIALCDEAATLDAPQGAHVLRGPHAALQLVQQVECDIVLAAMVGSSGLPATLAAVQQGRTVALANKETLVAAGSIIIPAARASGSQLLPVDSEHAALWQCLVGCSADKRAPAPPLVPTTAVAKAILTASGGPFRTWSKEQIDAATPQEALRHPTWNMGSKVTVDSAGLMNKALELIEAHWLFGLAPEQLGVLVHPQSIVHAIAQLHDGSSIAQLAPPDMRVPIQRALLWPACEPGLCKGIDWLRTPSLTFEPPDLARFPALAFADRVMRAGGSSGAILNAANEEAVTAFLQGRIRFGAIARVVGAVLDALPATPVVRLHDVQQAEAAARAIAQEHLHNAPTAA